MEQTHGQLELSDKYSLRGQVFDSIREAILSGKYHRNDELREMTLAKELGVSRTPIREALRQLELEGLVNIIPNKGAYVVGITDKDIRDIYEMRSMLEGLCARWATDNISKEDLEALEEINDLSVFSAEREKYDKVLELDNRFHQVLYRAAKSRMLDKTLSDFHHYLEHLRKQTLSSPERVHASIEEHKAIVQALKARDAKQAELLANAHIKKTMDNIEDKHLLSTNTKE